MSKLTSCSTFVLLVMDKVQEISAETWETAKSKASAVSRAAGSSVPKFRKPFLAIA